MYLKIKEHGVKRERLFWKRKYLLIIHFDIKWTNGLLKVTAGILEYTVIFIFMDTLVLGIRYQITIPRSKDLVDLLRLKLRLLTLGILATASSKSTTHKQVHRIVLSQPEGAPVLTVVARLIMDDILRILHDLKPGCIGGHQLRDMHLLVRVLVLRIEASIFVL